MSSALYTLNYSGQTSGGGGVVYIGNGKIVGIDASNFRYHGSYVEQGGRLNGTLGLTAPTAGELVTDKQDIQLSAGTRIELALDWALDFSNGKPQLIMIEGRPVHILFEKVRAGPGCLNKISASISGASAGFRLPSGVAAS